MAPLKCERPRSRVLVRRAISDASHVDLDLTKVPIVPPCSSRVFPSSCVCVVALSLPILPPSPPLVFPRVGGS